MAHQPTTRRPPPESAKPPSQSTGGRITPEEAGAVTAQLEAHVRALEAAGRRREHEKMEAFLGGGISG
jgi:hypothetical protein